MPRSRPSPQKVYILAFSPKGQLLAWPQSTNHLKNCLNTLYKHPPRAPHSWFSKCQAFVLEKTLVTTWSLLSFLNITSIPLAYSLPQGYRTVHGDVQFTPGEKTLTIQSKSPKAIVEYQRFNIAHDELVRFDLPGRQASILNRVFGGERTQIDGQILSNGQLLLVNSRGITVGPGARIDAAGLILSTLNMSNTSYLNGPWRFERNTAAKANIENHGHIETTPGGYVALVSSQINNTGTLTAPGGHVALAVGDQVTVHIDDTLALQVTIDQGLKDDLEASVQNSASQPGTIVNSGKIQGNQIILQAKAQDALFAGIVNRSGHIEANGVQEQNGTIILGAQSELGPAMVANQGTIEAPEGGHISLSAETGASDLPSLLIQEGQISTASTQHNAPSGSITLLGDIQVHTDGRLDVSHSQSTGGTMDILGEELYLLGDSHLNASGKTGGGTLHIGGDLQGSGELRRAKLTWVDPDVQILNNGTESGNGGRTILWSDGEMYFYGNIQGQGGSLNGDGGFAEVSGKNYLDFNGSVDLSAPHGNKGTLLLDPTNITIRNFDPVNLNPVVYLDATRINPAGLVACGPDSCVATWNDISGAAQSASQGIAGRRPILVPNAQNGNSLVRFDGIDDYIDGSALGIAGNSDVTYYLFLRLNGFANGGSGDGSGTYIVDRVPGTNELFSLKAIGGKFAYQRRTDAGGGLNALQSTTNITPGTFQSVEYVRDFGSTYQIYVNGLLENSVADGDTNTTPPQYKLGAHQSNGSGFVSGDYGDFLIFNRTLTTDERLLIDQYLNGKWGVNVSNANLNAKYLGQPTSILSQNYLEQLSKTANIDLMASNDITFEALNNNVLNLQGTASLTLTAGNQITMQAGDTLRTEGGAISLNAANGMTLGHLNTKGASNSLSGNITLLSNGAIDFQSLNAGTGIVQLGPSTSSQTIGIGGSPGAVQLTSAKAQTIGAGGLILGSDTASGTMTLGSLDLSTRNFPLTLRTTGTIVDGDILSDSAANILMAPNQNVTLTGGPTAAPTGAGAIGQSGGILPDIDITLQGNGSITTLTTSPPAYINVQSPASQTNNQGGAPSNPTIETVFESQLEAFGIGFNQEFIEPASWNPLVEVNSQLQNQPDSVRQLEPIPGETLEGNISTTTLIPAHWEVENRLPGQKPHWPTAWHTENPEQVIFPNLSLGDSTPDPYYFELQSTLNQVAVRESQGHTVLTALPIDPGSTQMTMGADRGLWVLSPQTGTLIRISGQYPQFSQESYPLPWLSQSTAHQNTHEEGHSSEKTYTMDIGVSPSGTPLLCVARGGSSPQLLQFKPESGELLSSRPLPGTPVAMAVDSKRGLLFVLSQGEDQTSRLQRFHLASSELIKTETLAGKALSLSLTPQGYFLYIGMGSVGPDESPGTILVHEVDTGRTESKVATAILPKKLGQSPDGTLYVLDGKSLHMVNTGIGATLGTVAIQRRPNVVIPVSNPALNGQP